MSADAGGAALLGDTDAAVEFLRRLHPSGYWVLCAIDPKTGKIVTEAFAAEREKSAHDWIAWHIGKANLYFTVNAVARAVTSKPKKTDIARAVALHVDIDPPGNCDDLGAAQAEILAKLRAFEPAPSAILFSGGGMQAFWLLNEATEDLVAVEAVNRGLEKALGGDHCHNVDRLMRLPGTINVPNKKKIEKGRTRALARIVEADWERRYKFEDFPAVVATSASPPGKAPTMLRRALPGWCRDLIERGPDPNGGDEYRGDRSRAVFAAACEMHRCGASADEIVATLTDRANGISAHVLDQSNSLGYAKRQAERAAENAGSPSFAVTDLGNGLRFAARHGADMRYCRAWSCWLIYDGQRWRRDETGEAIRRAKDTAIAIYDEAKGYARLGDVERQKVLAKWALISQSRRSLEAMEWAARSELPVVPDELDREPMLLNLRNGTLDLRTLTLRQHDRADLITKMADADLEPEAECPKWRAFLNRVLGGDAELIAFVRRVAGYALTASNAEHCFFLLHGTGRNGKSTFVDVIREMLGDYARPTEFRTLLARDGSDAVRNDIAALAGLRLVTAVEAERGRRLDEALIKQLTGGDKITARFMRAEFFDYTPTFKLFLAANHRPKIVGQDEGIWSRVVCIPFEIFIPLEERDRELVEKLRGERNGILRWAIDGLRDYRANGLRPPEKVKEAGDEYKDEMDRLKDFLQARCDEKRCAADSALSASEAWRVKAGDLYRAYTRFAESNGEEPLAQWQFGERMKAKGYASKLKKNSTENGKPEVARWYDGVRLKVPTKDVR